MIQNPTFLTATEALRQMHSGKLSARELLQASLAQIQKLDPVIHAWVHLNPETALSQADHVDAKRKQGQPPAALSGIPVGVKDTFNTRDMPTQMGSPLWAGFTPGNDARVVHKLRLAEAVIPGKTVTAEFAVHAPGPTTNPHNPAYMPGTSSSGSAAAVAGYMLPLAIGTQTAGSTIRPASYCGVYGFKPSFGLIPRTGMLKTTDSLDTIGFFSRCVEDLELLFDVIRVKGADFPYNNAALTDLHRQTKGDLPWRTGWIHGPKWGYAEQYARDAFDAFVKKLGGRSDVVLEEIELTDRFNTAHDIHGVIYDRTLAYYFKDEFKNHTLVSGVMYEIIERGNKTTVDDYKVALSAQEVIAAEFDQVFDSGYDAILDLSTGGEALLGLEATDRLDNCLIWTLCGNATINVPVFQGPNGLPFGLQLISRRYNDYLLLSFARFLRNEGIVVDGTNPKPALGKQ